MRRRRGSSAGTAGIEFALIAPALILAVLSTADIGFAIHESFEVDQALRNGAEAAMRDPGEAQVKTVLYGVDATGGEQARTAWNVDRYYTCPETPGKRLEIDSRNCSNQRPTAIFYEIKGVRPYPGIFLPARDLTRSASVQVR